MENSPLKLFPAAAAAAIAVFLLSLFLPQAAAAQSPAIGAAVNVSNLGEFAKDAAVAGRTNTANAGRANGTTQELAQAFTTGGGVNDYYALTDVTFDVGFNPDVGPGNFPPPERGELQITLHAPDSANAARPAAAALATLTKGSIPTPPLGSTDPTREAIWNGAADVLLRGGTTYFLVFSAPDASPSKTNAHFTITVINSQNEDAASSAGWGIANGAVARTDGTWGAATGTPAAIRIRASVAPAPPKVSNLAETSGGFSRVGGNNTTLGETAQAFSVGGDGSYALDSFEVALNGFFGNPDVLRVTIHAADSANNANPAAAALATLTGRVAKPRAAGVFTYMPAAGATVMLHAGQTYFAVFGTADTAFNNNYALDLTNADAEAGAPGWSIGNRNRLRIVGGTWRAGINAAVRIAVYASTIPPAPPSQIVTITDTRTSKYDLADNATVVIIASGGIASSGHGVQGGSGGTVRNAGAITTQFGNIGVLQNGGNNFVHNSGSIGAAAGAAGSGIVQQSGSGNRIVNTGLIHGENDINGGIYQDSGGNSIVNSGTITANRGGGSFTAGIVQWQDNNTLTHTGTITTTGGGADGVWISGNNNAITVGMGAVIRAGRDGISLFNSDNNTITIAGTVHGGRDGIRIHGSSSANVIIIESGARISGGGMALNVPANTTIIDRRPPPLSIGDAVTVSNLGEAHSARVFSTLLAQPFTTGGTSGDWFRLNDVAFFVSRLTGTAAGRGALQAALHSQIGGMPLATLSGTTPAATGEHTYSAPANTLLRGGATYFIVWSAPSSSATNRFSFSITNSDDESGSGGWSIGAQRSLQIGGSLTAINGPVRMRLRATVAAAPPPNHCAGAAFCVSNLNQAVERTPIFIGRGSSAYDIFSQEFTATGGGEFLLRDVTLRITRAAGNPGDLSVTLHAPSDVSSIMGPATAAFATLTGTARPRPAAEALFTFTPSAEVRLTGGSTYFVRLSTPDNGVNNNYQLPNTLSNAEDAGSNWTIADRAWRDRNGFRLVNRFLGRPLMRVRATAAPPAGDVISVGNISQSGNEQSSTIGLFNENENFRSAQAFTTGGAADDGFALRDVTIYHFTNEGNPGALTVAIHSAVNNRPGAKLARLLGPTHPRPSGRTSITYTAPAAGVTLMGATSYFIVLSTSDTTGEDINYKWINTPAQGETGSDGWSIANSRLFSRDFGATWESPASARPHKMQVRAVVAPAAPPPPPPPAGSVVSVSNFSWPEHFGPASIGRLNRFITDPHRAVGFTTGGNAGDSFVLHDITAPMYRESGTGPLTVTLRANSGGRPGAQNIATFTSTRPIADAVTASDYVFIPDTAVTLAGNTTYFFVASSPSTLYRWPIPASPSANEFDEDPGSTIGWGIQDGNFRWESTGWRMETFVPKIRVRACVTRCIPQLANAGATVNAAAGATVMLNGGASTGAGITYSWMQSGGDVTVMLSGANSVRPNFTAPIRAVDSVLVFELSITDVLGRTAADTVTVNVAASAELINALRDADQAERELGSARMRLAGLQSDLGSARRQLQNTNTDLAGVQMQLDSVNAEITRLRGAGVGAEIAAALAAAVVQRVDINGDGQIDADDFLIMYYAEAHAAELGDGRTGGTAAARARLLGGMRGAMPPGDAGLQMLLQRANRLRAGPF